MITPLKSTRLGYLLPRFLFNNILNDLSNAISQLQEIKDSQLRKEDTNLSLFPDNMIANVDNCWDDKHYQKEQGSLIRLHDIRSRPMSMSKIRRGFFLSYFVCFFLCFLSRVLLCCRG
jgi:hypothetical protein